METRSSSPLLIPRGRDYQSLNVRGLFPAGESAGHAGDQRGRSVATAGDYSPRAMALTAGSASDSAAWVSPSAAAF
jgi:uncharacterized FAD-dependent dehydrogenase